MPWAFRMVQFIARTVNVFLSSFGEIFWWWIIFDPFLDWSIVKVSKFVLHWGDGCAQCSVISVGARRVVIRVRLSMVSKKLGLLYFFIRGKVAIWLRCHVNLRYSLHCVSASTSPVSKVCRSLDCVEVLRWLNHKTILAITGYSDNPRFVGYFSVILKYHRQSTLVKLWTWRDYGGAQFSLCAYAIRKRGLGREESTVLKNLVFRRCS